MFSLYAELKKFGLIAGISQINGLAQRLTSKNAFAQASGLFINNTFAR